MNNAFYNDFDFERVRASSRTDDYRTPFQIDRDRLIHSSEFRRLQGKTQVFLPGENDYYRTRLTHTIEVAQIGRSICNFLTQKYKNYFNETFFIDPDLVESSCLAHDLGHPAFGHAGERTLNKLMAPYGGFEGNAQTLRLLTEIFYTHDDTRRGMKPTRAFLDGVLKYKILYSQMSNPVNHFLYDNQKEYVDFVFGGINIPNEYLQENKLNDFKSIECQIMDWADDTAYATNDLVDSISGGFITPMKLEKWIVSTENTLSKIDLQYLDEILSWIKSGKYKSKFGSQIGLLIESCKIDERKTFLDDQSNRYKFSLNLDEDLFERVELYKRIAVEMVFNSPQLHQIEFKGDFMLKNIFSVLEDNYINNKEGVKLLTSFTDSLIRREKDKMHRARPVCDYLSGMTDAFAMTTYKRLFDPDYSSITDVM
ncbi:MAG: dNTP triphosphohydrolase [Bacteroidetes bacterium]|nr:dNTP triphosphohydrolase [Bacteroidota bacterium]